MRVRRTLLAALAATLVVGTPTASATFHLMQIREVYPGSAAAPEADYVELQMWAAGQNFVGGHVLRAYDAGGNAIGASAFAHDAAGDANQSTLVLATPQAEAQFGIAADASLAANLSAGGGAVCWEAIDCLSWGSFSGTLPSSAGTPAAPGGIPDAMALRRSIARGCPTLLDFPDDSDQSAADLAEVFPLPRPNSAPPTERPCAVGGGAEGGSSGGGSGEAAGAGAGEGKVAAPGQGTGSDRALATFLRRKPPRRTDDPTPTFRFVASDGDVGFQCKLDRNPFRRCRSPFTAPRLRPGAHRFQVRARSGGEVDPTPASSRFRVLAAAAT